MKRILLGVMLSGMGAFCGMAYTISEYMQAPSVTLNLPTLPDSIQKENPFSPDKLLKSRHIDMQRPLFDGWKKIVGDSAGLISFEKGTQEVAQEAASPVLHTFATRLRAQRFAKGKLVLKSTSRAEVVVNGEVIISKSTTDSLPAEASSPLELLPEADYSIMINILSMSDDSGEPQFSLNFVPDTEFKDVDVVSAADLSRRVAPISTMTGERVSSVSMSPDGKYLLTKYRETISAKETRRRAVLSETATGKIISEDINTSAGWMPKGATIYYLKKGSKDFDMYTISLPSMNSRKIASAVPNEDVTVSPDGRYLLYYNKVEGDKEKGIMQRVKSPDDRIPGDRDRYYLSRYDLHTGIETILTYGGASTTICDMTQDGKKLLYMSSISVPNHYPFYKVSLLEMNMDNLKTDTIISNTDDDIKNAVYSPDGKQLFITAGPEAFNKIGANYGNHPIANSYDGQGFIYDIATRRARAMTKDFNPSIVGSVTWHPSNNTIYFIGERGFFRDLYTLDPGSGKIQQLAVDVQTVRGYSLGDEQSRMLAYYGGGFTADGEAFLLNLKSGKSQLVDAPLRKFLDNTEFGEMQPWKFTASDGTVIDGFRCLPPNFDDTKKYPLIVYYYGGTSPSSASFYHLYSPQVFASRDYVVYVVNPSGTTGYGQEFSARHVNAWGKRTAEDIIEGVKAFCKAHPYVDDKKIGCLGASYGGFMTQYLLTQTDIFAAAMSHAGISNVTSYWGEGYWGYSYNSVAAARSYPWSDPELYTRQGSLFNADKIHTPLLLLHGSVDTNVPIGESIQIFNALRLLGRDVEFITVSGENHVISGFDEKLVWQNTIMAWFAKWLQNDPRWWDSMYK